MELEIETLFHVSVTVSALVGLLLLLSWQLGRDYRALGWWGASFVLIAVGLLLLGLRGGIHHVLSIAIANGIIAIGAAMLWSGARVFDGRKAPLIAGLAGAVIWWIACLIPSFFGDINARTILISLILGIYNLLAAYELSRDRGEANHTWRRLATVLLGIHGLLFFVRIIFVLSSPLEEGLPGATSDWYLVLHYEVILYVVALGYVFLALAASRRQRATA
jgi:hypothetical protein